MTASLKWLLEESTIPHLKLLTHHQHLDGQITGVNIIDSPDMAQWIKPGELVLSSGYIFVNEPDMQEQIIQELKNSGCAAIGIKAKRFFPEIPANMLKLSESIGLPIIQLPYEHSLSDIAYIVNQRLYRTDISEIAWEQQLLFRHVAADNYYSPLFHYLENPSSLNASAVDRIHEYYRLPANKDAICVLLQLKQTTEPIEKIINILRDGLRETGVKVTNTFTAYDKKKLCLFLFSPIARPELFSFIQELQQLLPKESISISSTKEAPLPEAYSKALFMIKLTKIFPKQHCIAFQNHLIYWYIDNLSPDEKLNILQTTIQPLLDYDQSHHTSLVKTLEVYLECNMNSSHAATALYVHRNTFMKRLSKIQELLGTELDNAHFIFSLYMGICIQNSLKR